MEFRHLEHFIAVAETRNFTRAARRSHIVQSGLSVSIKSLERELGAPLFVRSPAGVEMTPAGEAFLPEARRILAAAETAREVVDEVNGLIRGSLSIGMAHFESVIDLPLMLSRYHEQYPGVHITVRHESEGSPALVECVRTNQYDVAFVSLQAALSHELAVVPVSSEHFDLVCPAGHPLASQRTVSLRDICREPFIDYPSTWCARAAIDRAFNKVERSIDLEVDSSHMMVDLVRRGFGVGFVLRSAKLNTPDVSFVPTRPSPSMSISLIALADPPPNPAAERFLRLVESSLELAPRPASLVSQH